MSDFGQFMANKVRLLSVDIVGASIHNPLEIIGMEADGFKFNLGFELGFDPDNRMAKTELEVNLSTVFEESEHQAKGKFQLAFLFGIDNFDELVKIDEVAKEIEASDDLAMALTSISYSTARGILLTRFQGTTFKDFILPVLSPAEILDNSHSPENGD